MEWSRYYIVQIMGGLCLSSMLCVSSQASPVDMQKVVKGETLPLESAAKPPESIAADHATALTPEQYNTMLKELQEQISRQNALLQMLVQHDGTPLSGKADSPVAPAEENTGKADSPVAPAEENTSKADSPVAPAEENTGKADSPVAPAEENTGKVDSPVASTEEDTGKADSLPVSGQISAPVNAHQNTEFPLGGEGSSTLPDTPAARQAYASGVSVWREIKGSVELQQTLGIHLDTQLVLAGLQDSAKGRELKLNEQDITDAMTSLNTAYRSRLEDIRQRQESEGKDYRVAFSKQKGVFSDAGSWYHIISKGKGHRLSASDMVTLKVKGSLPDGTVFDDSGSHGQTRQARVGSMLPAVAIGLQKVSRGGHFVVVVPPEKAYGSAGVPPSIPGGATLIFDIEVSG